MAKMNYLGHCRNMAELKAEYKRLAKVLHPDAGGTDFEMACLNDQYDNLSAILPMVNADGQEYQPTAREAPEEFRAAVMAVIFLYGVEVELCGSWLWVSGNTREHKDTIKAAGYKWSSNKLMWYWHETGYRKKGKRTCTIDEIRNMYGSEKITMTMPEALPA